MDYTNYKISYIKKEEFFSYIDWLTRFKNPINNLLRVCEKIITKNCLSPKFNSKKTEEMSLFEKFELTNYIWTHSLRNLLNVNEFKNTKLKDFLIFEEMNTFNDNILLNQIKTLEFEETNIKNQNYKEIREKLFLPLDEVVEYFSKTENIKHDYLKRLIQKQKSTLKNTDLFENKDEFASIKLLFLVEGITEEKLFPVFAEKSGFQFSQNGIKLKSAGGKTHLVKYYAEVRKLFKIPIFILLDADGKDITDELNDILEPKDRVYLISKGEIEDILPHSLIIKAINNYYLMEATICENDLNKNEPMTKILYNLYKEKGFGEFHKAKFAQIIMENISSAEDFNGEIEEILKLIQSK